MFVTLAKCLKESALQQLSPAEEAASGTRLAFPRKHLPHELSTQRLTVPGEENAIGYEHY